MPTKLLIIGLGGHAKVVLDAIAASKIDAALVCADEAGALLGSLFHGARVVELRDGLEQVDAVHIAIGDNTARRKLIQKMDEASKKIVTVRHPASTVSENSELGAGSFVAAGAVVSADVVVGRGVIINHGSVVDHDCKIGDCAHVAPGATLGGGVEIGQGVLVGAGAVILPGIRIGSGAVVGAGAVVTSDIDPDKVVAGVPARTVQQ